MEKKEIRVLSDSWKKAKLTELGYPFTEKGRKLIFYVSGEEANLCRKALFRRLGL